MEERIRPATTDDAEPIATIWNQGIEERRSTFETRSRTRDEIAKGMDGIPYLVADGGAGRVTGWARLAPWSSRDCYAGVGEASVYVDRGARGRGLGSRLLEELVVDAERRGHWKLVGLLFPENEASVALCRRAGFRELGTFRRHARLDGKWRDVLLVERLLGPAGDASDGG